MDSLNPQPNPLTMDLLTQNALSKELIETADLVGADVLLGIAQDTSLSESEVATARLAIALAFSAPRRGSVFANLRQDLQRIAHATTSEINEEQLEMILEQLQQSSLIQHPDDALHRPLVLDQHHLYLQRMWSYETQLVTDLLRIAQRSKAPRELSALNPIICALFPNSSVETPTLQHQAAQHFISSPFTVLTGGPGTGKTWTLRNALSLEFIVRKRRPETADLPPPVAILAAPTGKAAARMKDSIINKLDEHLEKLTPFLVPSELSELEQWLSDLPALTLHRLLGFRWDNPTRFKHHRGNPLSADLLLIDEASMIDLAMMAKLFAAVSTKTQLALLGDPNQLASVEAGTVLADICAQAAVPLSQLAPLREHIVELVESHRFNPNKGIGQFSLNCLGGRKQHSIALTSLQDTSDRQTRLISGSRYQPSQQVKQLITAELTPFFNAVSCATQTPTSILDLMTKFQILCAQKKGNFGVFSINELVETELSKIFTHIKPGEEYAGLRILITRNDPSTGLYNGDMGVLLMEKGGLRAFFPNLETSFAVARLPAWERATAMTIHKSQGSEFVHTMMILPSKASAIISRELIYTGATRASERLTIVSSEATLTQGLRNRISRHSGLANRLRDSNT